LFAKGVAETDTGKREAIYTRMQEIMDETGAYVYLTHEPEVFIHKSSLSPHFSPTAEMIVGAFKEA
jgi:peptide/nickel transport system substrate-binding protein